MQRWQAVGMVRGGMSNRQAGKRINVSHSVIVRLKQRVKQISSVKERQRTEMPLITAPREDTLLKRLARQQPFTTANTLRSRWIVNGRISRRTINRRLNNARFHARRPIKRPLLTTHHKTARLQWAREDMRWIIRSWQRVHWSDESPFLLNPLMTASARMEIEKHSTSTGTYCRHNCAWWRWCYCLGMLLSKL